jgi:hypothetical protein
MPAPPPRRLYVKLILATTLALLSLPASTAFAGRLVVTGHDADLHCTNNDQCHFVKIAVDFVRAGAPDPTKPVLVLDRSDLDMNVALDNAFGPGAVPRVIMDPRSPEFASAALTTDQYSAILVASDTTCGGCDLNEPTETSETPDSDAINARKDAIAAFFNAGGGIFAAAGSSHGDGDTDTGPDTYYNFVPLPLGGKQVAPPFTLTEPGRALGFEDSTNGIGTNDDINCCPTHNSFQEPPSGSALQVAERDSSTSSTGEPAPAPETLFADGKIENGAIVKPPVTVPPEEIGLPPSNKCIDRRKFEFDLKRRSGRKVVRVEVYISTNMKKRGKLAHLLKGKNITSVRIKKLPERLFKVTIRTTHHDGTRLESSRKYYPFCKKGKPTTIRPR